MSISTTVVPPRPDREFIRHLATLTPERRLADYQAGLFNRHQLTLWATHYPQEVPLLNDELPWIAAYAE